MLHALSHSFTTHLLGPSRGQIPSARGTVGAPLPAISCLGAFRTPAYEPVDSLSCRRPTLRVR